MPIIPYSDYYWVGGPPNLYLKLGVQGVGLMFEVESWLGNQGPAPNVS